MFQFPYPRFGDTPEVYRDNKTQRGKPYNEGCETSRNEDMLKLERAANASNREGPEETVITNIYFKMLDLYPSAWF